MSRNGAVRSGFSLARLKSSSNFFSNTLPWVFSASNCFWNTSSRRAPAPFNLATSAARSSIGLGFSGTVCAITEHVSGSTFRIAWQHGHATSNIALTIEPWYPRKGYRTKVPRKRRLVLARDHLFSTDGTTESIYLVVLPLQLIPDSADISI